MHLVALTELAEPDSPDLPQLAGVLESSAYELRLALNKGLPVVVLVTDDVERAEAVVAELRSLGHRALRFDANDIVSCHRMPEVRAIRFEAEGVGGLSGSSECLFYVDLLCMLRAMHTTTTRVVEKVTERKLRPGMALATGGLILTKKTSREVQRSHDEHEQVLYLFRRSGEPTWILREQGMNYAALGPELAHSAAQNFASVIRELRARAPHATYDERLLRSRSIPGVAPGVETVDIYAHILAASLARSEGQRA